VSCEAGNTPCSSATSFQKALKETKKNRCQRKNKQTDNKRGQLWGFEFGELGWGAIVWADRIRDIGGEKKQGAPPKKKGEELSCASEIRNLISPLSRSGIQTVKPTGRRLSAFAGVETCSPFSANNRYHSSRYTPVTVPNSSKGCSIKIRCPENEGVGGER
jgi:hypothetical protein